MNAAYIIACVRNIALASWICFRLPYLAVLEHEEVLPPEFIQAIVGMPGSHLLPTEDVL